MLPAACHDLPEVSVTTPHFEIAPDFDSPICRGTTESLERHLEYVESALWSTLGEGERIRYYWLTSDIAPWCGDGRTGCYFPGTRVVVAGASSIYHELVHVVLDAEAGSNFFAEEAISGLYSGIGVDYRAESGERPSPSDLLNLTQAEYQDGELDYVVASHFLNYVHRSRGRSGVRSIARAVRSGESASHVKMLFEAIFKTEFSRIETLWETRAPRRYAGLRERNVARIEANQASFSLDLNCDSPDTHGPLVDGAPGMYRTVKLHLDRPATVQFRLDAPADILLRVVNVGSQRNGSGIDFEHPEKIDGPILSRLEGVPIAPIGLDLAAGTYLLVATRHDYEPARVELRTQVLPTFSP